MEKSEILSRAKLWLSDDYDKDTQKQVQNLIDTDIKELTESFYKNLEFGTGGLRGIMGVGTNRMNRYTVGAATQGFANYIKKQKPNELVKIAVAHDPRNKSPYFAKLVSDIFVANGFTVYLFDSLRPTPELSFAIRHFGCTAGVMITASHNPKEYNGYKAYWDDGGQVIAPHDVGIISEVDKVTNVSEIKFSGGSGKIISIGEEVDKIYLDKLITLSLNPDVIKKQKDLKIVYTPLHGAGVKLVPEFIKKMGFENIIAVPEQNINDGNFPTVEYPNPEEPSAMKMAIDKAIETGADLVMASDPDADRIGVAIRNEKGEIQLINGNQIVTLLTYYCLSQWKEKGKLKGKEYTIKTIVTTELIARIAEKYNVELFDTLTGFKNIAEVILANEDKKTFICGGEESNGFLIGDFSRDKDSVIACGIMAEVAAWAKEQGKTLYDLLMDIYMEFGVYYDKLLSITKKGIEGASEISQMMVDLRNNPPKEICGSKVITIKDYSTLKSKNVVTGEVKDIKQSKSNVLQFFTEDGTTLSARPSGTEPKIKFYTGMKGDLKSKGEYRNVVAKLEEKYNSMLKELKLN